MYFRDDIRVSPDLIEASIRLEGAFGSVIRLDRGNRTAGNVLVMHRGHFPGSDTRVELVGECAQTAEHPE